MERMFGKKSICEQLIDLIDNNKFPRFSILIGNKGSGRKFLTKWIASQMNLSYCLVPTTVDDIRAMISTANKAEYPTLYVIADADRISPAARNALLKVTEEPPKNAYFIMTLLDPMNTIATIRSRGTMFHMDSYTPYQLGDYYQYIGGTDFAEQSIIEKVCSVPGEVDMLKGNAEEFYAYVEKVLDNIAEVSWSNVFKIADKIKFKDTDDGYDLALFWHMFAYICMDRRIESGNEKYYKAVLVTHEYFNDLRIQGINKSSTFDMWIFDVRRELS